MKKLFLTSGVILCMACPAFAEDPTVYDIKSDNVNLTDNTPATCQYPTLGVYDESQTFYAKWTAHPYTVAYNKNYGTLEGSTSVTGTESQDTVAYNTSYAIKTIGTAGFARIGYTFDGWVADHDLATGDATAAPNMTPYAGTSAQNVTFLVNDTQTTNLYATWKANKYNVVYNKNNHATTGSTDYTDPEGMTFDTEYEALPFGEAPISTHMSAAEGYTFRGWSKSASSQYVAPEGQQTEAQANPWIWTGVEVDSTEADNLSGYKTNGYNVYAIYSANNWTLTYNCGKNIAQTKSATPVEGQALATSSTYPRTYDDPAAALFDPSVVCELAGYHVTPNTTWTCVNTSDNNSSVELADIAGTWKVDGNVTCTASWTPNDIELTWKPGTGATALDGTSAYAAGTGADECTYDGSITVGAKPAKAGYDFQGWTTNKDNLPAGTYVFEPATPGQGND